MKHTFVTSTGELPQRGPAPDELAVLFGRRWRARAARATALRQVEGGTTYEAHQEVLRTAERLALEGRLSRFLYAAVKPIT